MIENNTTEFKREYIDDIKKTAITTLNELVKKGLLVKVGNGGGTKYMSGRQSYNNCLIKLAYVYLAISSFIQRIEQVDSTG